MVNIHFLSCFCLINFLDHTFCNTTTQSLLHTRCMLIFTHITRPSARHMFHGINDANHNAIITTWNRVVLDVGNTNRFLKSRRIARSNKCRLHGCNGIEDADHILFDCQSIEHAGHQQILKNNIRTEFQIPPGVRLSSLMDVMSAMSDAETKSTENLFILAKLIHTFITHHHDSGLI